MSCEWKIRCVLTGLVAVALAGCDSVELQEVSVPPPPVQQTEHQAAAVEATPRIALPTLPAGEAWISAEQLPWETWYLQYVGGRRVGYIHLLVTKGATFLRVKRIAQYRAGNPQRPLQYRIELEALEYSNGKPASFTERTVVKDTVEELRGELVGSTLRIERVVDGKKQSKRIEWQDGTWGVVGLHAMLKAAALQPGQLREATLVLTGVDSIARVELAAREPESVSLPGSPSRKLVPIDVTFYFNDRETKTRSWIDQHGEIYKTTTLDGTMASTYRVSPEIGQRVADEFRFEMERDRTVPLIGEVPSADASRVVYKIETTVDLFSRIPQSRRQIVTSRSALQLRIVTSSSPASDAQTLPTEQELHDCLASTELLPVDAENVKALLAGANLDTTARTDSQILQLARHVAQHIGEKPLTAEIRDLHEVLREASGHFIERTLATITVLRAAGFPARMVCGLKPSPDHSLRLYTWCEAWEGSTWLSVDPADGNPLNALPIEITRSNLTSENVYPPLLEVLSLMPQMTGAQVESAN